MMYICVSHVMRGADNMSREQQVPLRERLRLLVNLVPPIIVFGVVMGSLYFGIATATESAALGVVIALAFTWHSGKLSF